MRGDAHSARRDDLVFARVREALTSGGCPVCRLATHAVQRFLDNFLYERVNDPKTREEVRASWGFCPHHAWALPAQRNPVLGVAIVYRDLVGALRDRLDAALRGHPRRRRDAGAALHHALRPAAPCPACLHRQRMEEVYVASLLEHSADPEVRQALAGPAPLCLPHLLLAASLVRSPEHLTRLLEDQRQALARLEADLSELVRKHDYRFRHEGLTPEQGASWTRALEVLSGRDPNEIRAAVDARPRPMRSPTRR
ncbi:MAG: DUF6062 family protein [bacterium]